MAQKPKQQQQPEPEITVGEGYQIVDEGAYPARVAWCVDLGIQAGYQDGPPRRQLLVGFELQNATSDGETIEERPILSKRYGIAWGEQANLPKFLRAIGVEVRKGAQLRLALWLGQPCTVMVEHKAREGGGASARIASVARCATKLPELAAEAVLYPGLTAKDDLPEWVQDVLDEALQPAATGKGSKRTKAPVPELPEEAGKLDDVRY